MILSARITGGTFKVSVCRLGVQGHNLDVTGLQVLHSPLDLLSMGRWAGVCYSALGNP